jgi:hypothetical protein
MCRSESECKGDFSAITILAIVLGTLLGICLLRFAYIKIKAYLNQRSGSPLTTSSQRGSALDKKKSGQRGPGQDAKENYLFVDSSIEGGGSSLVMGNS